MIVKINSDSNDPNYKSLLNYLKASKVSYIDKMVDEIGVLFVDHMEEHDLYDFSCVRKVVEFKTQDHKDIPIIKIKDVEVGGNKIVVIGGPCSVESLEHMETITSLIESRIDILRAGAFKPRTSPYSFQGLEKSGIEILEKIREEHNIPICTEIVAAADIGLFKNVDLIQVGARNMQNFDLLKALGKTDKPILLKRGFSNTIEEWIMSAEYIISNGNNKVILCERGIRTFETYTRNTLDLSAVIAAKRLTNLPVIVDPSHASGKWDFVEDLSKAAIAAGADGLMIEIHDNPDEAVSDGAQSLKPKKFARLTRSVRKIAEAVGRTL